MTERSGPRQGEAIEERRYAATIQTLLILAYTTAFIGCDHAQTAKVNTPAVSRYAIEVDRLRTGHHTTWMASSWCQDPPCDSMSTVGRTPQEAITKYVHLLDADH